MLFSFLENFILYVEEMICYITYKFRHPLRDIEDHSMDFSYEIPKKQYAVEIDIENR
jgi:hypothetical protein